MSFKAKYGICAGKFRILHKGHKEYFIQASGEVEKIHIVIADDEKTKRYSSVYELKQSIGEIMKNLKIDYEIHISPNYRGDIEGWEQWLIDNLKIEDVKDWIIFNSKENYENHKLKNGYLNLFMSKKISSSNIEENPYTLENSNYICDEFLPYMNKKIVISGTESCGKTVMCKKLSTLFDTKFSEEYGRYHGRKFLGGQDDCYRPKDFAHIAMQQILQDKEVNLGAKRILVVDTDMIVTLRFLYEYMEELKNNIEWTEELEQEFIYAENTLRGLAKVHKQDLTILLAPTVEYYDDGIRWSKDNEERMRNYEDLKKLYDEFDIKYVEVKSSNYNDRFKEAVKYVTDVIGIK